MSNIVRTEKFIDNNKEYDINVISVEDGYKVVAFEGSRKLRPFTYSVSSSTDMDFHGTFGVSAVDHIIETIKSEIKAGWLR